MSAVSPHSKVCGWYARGNVYAGCEVKFEGLFWSGSEPVKGCQSNYQGETREDNLCCL